MSRYQLAVRGDLFFTRVALKQAGSVRVVNLLVDCGSSFTILSWGTFASLGLDPSASKVRQPIKTANGLVWMPKLSIEQIQAFGQKFSNLQVLAHTIPLGSQVHGILGMNYLRQFDFKLIFKQAVIEIA